MKFIITEEQNNKLYKFILYKFKGGESPKSISKMGIPIGIIVDTLMDVEIPSKSEPRQICSDFYIELIDTLWNSKKLLKQFEYEDGRKIFLDYDMMSGSMSYDYGGENSVRIYGYATAFWDGACGIPVDMEEYTFGEKWESIHMYKLIDLKKQIKKIRTYGDLIKFHNEDYFKLIKSVLDGFIDEIKEEL